MLPQSLAAQFQLSFLPPARGRAFHKDESTRMATTATAAAMMLANAPGAQILKGILADLFELEI